MKTLKQKQWMRYVALALLGCLSLWLVLWLAVPVVLKSQIQRLASEKLGRTVTLDAVDFKPWTLELSLHGLRIEGVTGAPQPLLSVERIYLDAEIQSLLRLAPVLDAMEIDRPVLHLAQTQPGEFDVDDIRRRLAQPSVPDEAATPPRFAFYNIVVRDGAVDFHDATIDRTHTVRGLALRVPFLSNLPSQQQAVVAPQLAFELNGSRFDSTAQSTPFEPSRATDLRLAFRNVDLANYLSYLPRTLPVRLTAGVLDGDLDIAFEQSDEPVVRVRGAVSLSQTQLQAADGQELLQFERLALQLRDVQPLRQQVLLDSVVLTQPRIAAQRNAQGMLNWLALAGPAPATVPAHAQSASDPAPAAWRVEVADMQLQQGHVQWRDQSRDAGPQGAHWVADQVDLRARAFALPLVQPVEFSGQMTLASAAMVRSGAAPGRLAFSGQATGGGGQVGVQIDALPLAVGAPYLSVYLQPGLQGQASAQLGLGWKGSVLVAKLARLALNDLALQDAQAPSRIRQVLLEDADLHLPAQQVRIGRLTLDQPQLQVRRDAQGRWMYEPWRVASAASAPAPRAQAVQRPWRLRLQHLVVQEGGVDFQDLQPPRPVQAQVTGLQLQVRDFAPLEDNATPSVVQLSARVASGRRVQAGRLAYDGSLRLSPLRADGAVQLRDFPLHAFEPYVADLLNVRVQRADGGFVGRVHYESAGAGGRLALQGDAQLSDVRVRTGTSRDPEGDAQVVSSAQAATAEPAALSAQSFAGQQELFNWKQLAVRGLEVMMAPGSATQVRVRETALSDFYARVIVQSNGRLNLQDLVRAQAVPDGAAPSAGLRAAAGSDPDESGSSPGSAPAPVVHVGPVVLTGGTVAFSDYFIQPNYSADLSGLAGRLSAFSSVAPAEQSAPLMADLELRGRAQGTADLEILGRLNPLAKPLALDITSRMTHLELSPLTPYAIKYVGHGIERGKLSMDVNYRITPDGQLTASNKLVLNQLTFGEPVDGAPASLPVRLATALLTDRNGVIDLDLPISGSLNDPQFRIAPVIFKIIGNLIMKAVTSPFALLASVLGGDDTSRSAVTFAPGSAELDDAGRQALDRIAKALRDRPALQMTVVGEAVLAVERDGWKQAQLQQMLLAQKRREAVRKGQPAASVTQVESAEIPVLLKAVYRRADITKPRNLLGLPKDLPEAEMQALLLAHIDVSDTAMRELAVARGVTVRDYLAAQDLPAERLFLGAPAQPSSTTDWKPQARLELHVR